MNSSTQSLTISNFKNSSSIKSFFVFHLVCVEIYESREAKQPNRQIMYKNFKEFGCHETGIFFHVSNGVFWLRFTEEQKSEYDYVLYLLEKNKKNKTQHVPIDLGDIFPDIKLETLTPHYSFNKEQFMLLEEERKKKEQERRDQGEEDEL